MTPSIESSVQEIFGHLITLREKGWELVQRQDRSALRFLPPKGDRREGVPFCVFTALCYARRGVYYNPNAYYLAARELGYRDTYMVECFASATEFAIGTRVCYSDDIEIRNMIKDVFLG